MPAARIAFATPATAPRWQRALVFSPAARIVLFALLLIAIGFSVHTAMTALGWMSKGAPPLQHALATFSTQLLPPLIGYLILVRFVERRRIGELALRDIPVFGCSGLLLGFVLFSVVVGILWLAGSYHVTGTNHHVDWVFGLLVLGIGAGIGEEIITRGVLFRVIEEGMGTWWALLISASFFGAGHVFNPGATIGSSMAIMIEAGVLLALLYHVTRSLWACIGLHAAWNITEGMIYGVSVSGGHQRGWLQSTLTGPTWLTGGAFGAEASVVAVAVCSALSMVLLAIALRRRLIVPPGWRRDPAKTQSGSLDPT